MHKVPWPIVKAGIPYTPSPATALQQTDPPWIRCGTPLHLQLFNSNTNTMALHMTTHELLQIDCHPAVDSRISDADVSVRDCHSESACSCVTSGLMCGTPCNGNSLFISELSIVPVGPSCSSSFAE